MDFGLLCKIPNSTRIMKKLLFIIAVLTAAPCLAQTEVNSFFAGANEGVTYYLPDTKLEITVNTACITRTPGEFNRYAERYLRINNAIASADSYWELTDVKVKSIGIPNSEKMYTIKLNNSTAGNVSINESGIIEAINTKPAARSVAEVVLPTSKKKQNDASKYMTSEILQATSTAKMAELTAKEIYLIRESKLAITRGLAENMPQDGQSMQLVLDELDKQERALTELFIGRTDTVYHTHTYTLLPTAKCDTTKAVLLRFSRKLGVLDKENLAGAPVYYNLRDLKSVKIPTAEELEKKKLLKKEGVCYNIPGKAELTIYTGSRRLYDEEIPIAQLGVTEILSKTLFNKKTSKKVVFDTATGAVTNIEDQ